MKWLSLEQIKVARGFGRRHRLNVFESTGDLLKYLSLEQLKAIEHPNEIGTSSYITDFVESNKGYFKNTKDLEYIWSGAEFSRHVIYNTIPFLEPHEFEHVTLKRLKQFPEPLINSLTPDRLVKIPSYAKSLTRYYVKGTTYGSYFHADSREIPPLSKEHIQSIPVENIPDLSFDVIEAFNHSQHSSFTFDQIQAMTKEQLSYYALRPYIIIWITERDKADQQWVDNFIRFSMDFEPSPRLFLPRSETTPEEFMESMNNLKNEKLEECEQERYNKSLPWSSYHGQMYIKNCIKDKTA